MRKKCVKCNQEKLFIDFFADKQKKDGRRPRCKSCEKSDSQSYYTNNKEKIIERQKKYYQSVKDEKSIVFREKRKKLYWSNPEKYRKLSCGYIKNNPQANSKRRADYRSRLLKAIPCWYDKKIVQEIYDFAQEFRNAGFKVDVDHIVPLKNKKVCGLHVQDNLRVCLQSKNRSKGNKYA